MASLKEKSLDELLEFISLHTDERMYALAEALRKGATVDELHQLTMIDCFFLDKLVKIIEIENELKENPWNKEVFIKAKKSGFADSYIAKVFGSTAKEVYEYRKANNIYPVYKMIDTCAAEFDAYVPY